MKYQVEKSTAIDADMDTVRSHIENFEKWNTWSPWTIADPNAHNTYAGNPGKSGHKMEWESDIIGTGTNTLRKIYDNKLEYDLEFLKPFKSSAKTTLHFKEDNSKTTVTWVMDSSMPFFLFFMVPAMRNLIGMDYERGLRMLKEVAEKGRIDATTTSKGVVNVEGFSYVGLERSIDYKDIAVESKKAFDKVLKDVVMDRNISAKHWVCLYPKFNMKNMTLTFIAAVSDENLKDTDLGPDYVRGEVKAGKALEAFQQGSYDFLGNAWSMGMAHTRALKLKSRSFPYEYYRNSPFEVAPEELKTSVFFPIK